MAETDFDRWFEARPEPELKRRNAVGQYAEEDRPKEPGEVDERRLERGDLRDAWNAGRASAYNEAISEAHRVASLGAPASMVVNRLRTLRDRGRAA